jgi:NAD(P)-dependent dehydrogenase (short-subunit alcohol dehydrogenase family)
VTNQTPTTGRVAVVTGGGGGLGRATALKLAEQGMVVVAVDRNEHNLEDLPEGISREVFDSTDSSAAAPMMERIAHDVGAPDVLVNTIGTYITADALSTTPDQWRLMLDINLAPALWLSQAVAPYMQERGSGAIVHIAARQGLEPSTGTAAYSVSKAALIHLTRVLDLELRPTGIRVNAVVPQLINTEKNRAFIPKEVLSHAVAPEAIAEVIAFLVSDAAAPVSGAILPVYGN